jgi:hypothetical protein
MQFLNPSDGTHSQQFVLCDACAPGLEVPEGHSVEVVDKTSRPCETCEKVKNKNPSEQISKDDHAEKLREKIVNAEFNGLTIPYYMVDGLVNYIAHKVPAGDFLMAVFRNDLKGALDRADDTNIMMLPIYGFVLHNFAPMNCYGSTDKVNAWLDSRKPS